MPFVNRFRDFGDCECGLVFYLDRLHIARPIPVPLKKVQVKAKVVGFVAEISVEQQYINHESNPIEALYMFPVEESAAVIDFLAEVDGRKITTVVKEKERAAEEYQEAIRDQRTAFLLSETKPDIFQIKVGHLKPGAGAKITLKYVTELPVDAGSKASRLTIPTTIAPRYIPATDNSPEAQAISQIGYSLDTPAPMTIDVETTTQSKIKSVHSPSHSITSQIEGKRNGQFTSKSSLTASTTDMDRDFIYLIETEDPNKPTLFVEKNENSTAAMVSMVPNFELDDQKVEIIFLVDRSGSMDGMGIQQAKEALHLFIHSLPSDCYFNICSFGSRYEFLFEQSRPYTDETLSQAKSIVSSMTANFGGTEIFTPLQAIFKSTRPSKEHLRQIFVLTDGQVSNVESVISLVKKHSDAGRTFAMGLGSSASRHLVKGVSRSGGGTAVFAGQGEDLRPKVMTQLKNALQPAMSNVKLVWKGVTDQVGASLATEVVVEKKKTLMGYMKPKNDEMIVALTGQAPVKIPPIFDGSRLLVYRLFEEGESPRGVTITAASPDGPLTAEIPLDSDSEIEGDFVQKLAARKKIQDLEEWDGMDVEKVKEAIVKLGCKYSLASKHTSFIGVDLSDKKTGHFAAMETRNIKQQVNSGAVMFGGPMMNRYCAAPFGSFGLCQQQQLTPPQNTSFGAAAPTHGSSAFLQEPLKMGGFSFGAAASPVPGGPMSQPQKMRYVSFLRPSSNFQEKSKRRSRSRSPSRDKAARSSSEMDDDEMDAAFDNVSRTPLGFDNLSEAEQMTALVSLQGSNGIFRWDPVLAEALDATKEDIELKCPEGVPVDVWITAIVVVLFKKRLASLQDMWELVVKKAMKQIRSFDERSIMSHAEAVVG